MKYNNFEFTPTMSAEDFVAENEEYFVNDWLENNPTLAHMVNDGDLQKFYDDLDRDRVKEKMIETYEYFLDENF